MESKKTFKDIVRAGVATTIGGATAISGAALPAFATSPSQMIDADMPAKRAIYAQSELKYTPQTPDEAKEALERAKALAAEATTNKDALEASFNIAKSAHEDAQATHDGNVQAASNATQSAKDAFANLVTDIENDYQSAVEAQDAARDTCDQAKVLEMNYKNALEKAEAEVPEKSAAYDAALYDDPGDIQPALDTLTAARNAYADAEQAHTDAVSKRDAAYANLNEKNQALSDANAALNNAKSGLAAAESALQSAQSAYDRALSELNGTIDGVSLESKRQEADAARSTFEEKQNLRRQAEIAVTEAETAYNKAVNDKAAAQAAADAAQRESDSIDLNSAQNTVNDAQSAFNSAEAELNSITTQVNDARQTLANLESEKQQAITVSSQAEQEYYDAQNAYNNAEASGGSGSDGGGDAGDLGGGSDAGFDISTQSNEDLKAAMDAAFEAWMQAQGTVASKQEECNSAQSTLDGLVAQESTATGALESARAKLADAQNTYARLEEQKNTANQTRDQKLAEVSTLEYDTIPTKSQDLSNAKSTYNNALAEEQAAQRDYSTQHDEYTNLLNSLGPSAENLLTAENMLYTQREAKQSAEELVTAANKAITDAEAEVQKATDAIQPAEAEVVARQNALAPLEQAKIAAESDYEQLNARRMRIVEAEKELREAEEAVTNLNTKIEEIAGTIADAEEQVRVCQEELDRKAAMMDRASSFSYESALEKPIDDEDFAYLNEFITKQREAEASVKTSADALVAAKDAREAAEGAFNESYDAWVEALALQAQAQADYDELLAQDSNPGTPGDDGNQGTEGTPGEPGTSGTPGSPSGGAPIAGAGAHTKGATDAGLTPAVYTPGKADNAQGVIGDQLAEAQPAAYTPQEVTAAGLDDATLTNVALAAGAAVVGIGAVGAGVGIGVRRHRRKEI